MAGDGPVPTGTFSSYTPNANYHGADSFTFKANDGTLDSQHCDREPDGQFVDIAPACAGRRRERNQTPRSPARSRQAIPMATC